MTTGKSDLVSIRVPYKNLHDDSSAPELELVDVNHRNLPPSQPPPNHSPSPPNNNNINAPLLHLVLSCTVAAGVQFGWALQLSLLTPYIQVPLPLPLPLQPNNFEVSSLTRSFPNRNRILYGS